MAFSTQDHYEHYILSESETNYSDALNLCLWNRSKSNRMKEERSYLCKFQMDSTVIEIAKADSVMAVIEIAKADSVMACIVLTPLKI